MRLAAVDRAADAIGATLTWSSVATRFAEVAAAARARRPRRTAHPVPPLRLALGQIAVGLVVIAIWGTTLLRGLVPEDGISWQGHLFGAVGGVLVAGGWVHGRVLGWVAGLPRGYCNPWATG